MRWKLIVAGLLLSAVVPLSADVAPAGEPWMLTDHHGGEWEDVEKSPDISDDDLLCWAAVCANTLQWTGWGQVGGLGDADAIFDYYRQHWTDSGGLASVGWEWWFSGENTHAGRSGYAQLEGLDGGGFWDPPYSMDDYYHSAGGSNAPEDIHRFLDMGCGVGIVIRGGGGHVMTVWGVDVDREAGEYLGLFVTDSDDGKLSPDAPDQLRYYRLTRSGTRWYFQDFYGTSNVWYVSSIEALQAPDPATALALLMGLPVLLRRRHS